MPPQTVDEAVIDPALLAEEAAGVPESDDAGSDPSDINSNGDDEYVEEDAGVLTEIGMAEKEQEDVVFSRLAGEVSKGGAAMNGDGNYFGESMRLLEAEEDRPRRRTRQTSRRSRKAHKPNHEVQQLLGKANLAYASDSAEAAIPIYLEIIRLDPYVYSAWTSLASCHGETGNEEAARQMRLCAAHIDNDGESWKELAVDYRRVNQNVQSIYCWRKALRLEPNDVGMLYELASLYRIEGSTTKAVEVFKRILKAHLPSARDMNILAEFQPLFTTTSQVNFIISAYRKAFDWHISQFDGPDDARQRAANTMNLEHVVQLVDLMLQSDNLEDAVVVIRKGQRWLQGRRDQKFWDSFKDDREYDSPGTVRVDVTQEEGDELERHDLETNLRHRLALARLRLGDDSEALTHVDEILQLDVIQVHFLVRELGDMLLRRELWERALDCFAAVQDCETIPDDPTAIYHMAICQHELKQFSQAHEALRWVIDNDPGNIEAKMRLANVLEDTGKKVEALELVSEVIRARAHRDKDKPERSTPQHRAEKAVDRTLSKRVLEDQMRSKMQALWSEVQEAEQGIGQGDVGALERFVEAAGTMIENYRLAKGNFTKARGVARILRTRNTGKGSDYEGQLLAMQDRLERVMGFDDEVPITENDKKYLLIKQSDFYGLTAEEWLTLIVKYCCVLMVKDEADVSMDILDHVVWSGLFYNRRSEIALRLTAVACAMRLRAYDKIIENCKRLGQMHQFSPEPFNLMMACLGGGGSKASAAWLGTSIQHFVHRELRIYDQAVQGSKLRYKPGTQRWAPIIKIGLSRQLGDEAAYEEDDPEEERQPNFASRGVQEKEDEAEDDDDGDEEGSIGTTNVAQPTRKPKVISPDFNALYGMAMLCGKAHQSSLYYLFRAYEANQDDPLICLLIAQAFFGRAMTRQVDNRNYMITQGLAFLTRYRKLTPQDPISQEEVEYNYGRSFHGLGVPHLAVKHYERVLASVKTRMNLSEHPEEEQKTSLAGEAAYNLTLLYAASGAMTLVKDRSQWLAI